MSGTNIDMDGHIIGLDNKLVGDVDHQSIAHVGFNELNMKLGSGADTVFVEVSDTIEDNNDFAGHEPQAGQDFSNFYLGEGNDELVLFDEQYIRGSYDGEADSDKINYALWTSSVLVDLRVGKSTGFNFGYDDGLVNLENITGSISDDFLYGNDSNNTIRGSLGNDLIYGYAGADVLGGDLGFDSIFGGTGDDRYLVTADLDIDGESQSGDVFFENTEPTLIDPNDPSLGMLDLDLDTLDFSGFDGGDADGISINLSLDSGQVQRIHSGSNSELALNGYFENVIGTSFNDDIDGNELNNVIAGNGGADDITGGSDGVDNLVADAADTIGTGTGEVSVIIDPASYDIDTTAFGAAVKAQNPEDFAGIVVEDTNKDDATFTYTVTEDDGGLLVFEHPDDSSRILFVETDAAGTVVKVTDVGDFKFLKINGTNKSVDSSNPADKIIRIENLDNATNLAFIEVNLRAEKSVLDAENVSQIMEIQGSSHDDRIQAGSGNDLISGGSGDDVIFGGAGHDGIDGDSGDDVLFGELGDDRLVGGDGNDLLYGGFGNDLLFGDGTVIFQLNEKNELEEHADGTLAFKVQDNPHKGNDILIGNEGHDYLDGNKGNDVLIGDEGIVYAEDYDQDGYLDFAAQDSQPLPAASEKDGNDILFGSDGNDLIFGGAGRDSLDGGTDFDYLEGGVDDDFLRSVDGDNIIIGHEGDDEVLAYNLTTMIYGGFGDDDINVPDNAIGTVDGGPGVDEVAEPENNLFTVNLVQLDDDSIVKYVIDWGDGLATVIDVVNPAESGEYSLNDDGSLNAQVNPDSSLGFGFIQHVYDKGGKKEISLRYILDDDSVIDDGLLPVITAKSGPDTSVVPNEDRQYFNEPMSLSASAFDIGVNDALEYLWEISDGTTYDTPEAIHEFESPGEYTITLTVTDQDGDTFVHSFTIFLFADPGPNYVIPAPPKLPKVNAVKSYTPALNSSAPVANLFNRSTSGGSVASYSAAGVSGEGQSPLNTLTILDLVPDEIDQQFLDLFSQEPAPAEEGEKKAEGDTELGDDFSKLLPEEESKESKEKKKEEKEEKDNKKPLSFFKRTINSVAAIFRKV